MHVKGLPQRGGGRPKFRELRGVVVSGIVRRSYLREAIDHEAMKAELLHASLQFSRGRTRILHRHGRKAAEFGWVALHVFSQDVIRSTGHGNRFMGIMNTLNA